MKIAMLQLKVEFKKVEENFRNAENEIAKAAGIGCRCAVLPECFDVGWGAPDALKYADSIPGERTERLCALAKKYGMFIVAGLTENDSGRCYNTAVIIDENGIYLGKHRKINVLKGIEDMVYGNGDRLGVYEAGFGKVGVNICADNLFHEESMGRAQAAMGAKIVLSPCAWAVPPEEAAARKPYGNTWLKPYKALAKDYGMWVIGVSSVGHVGGGVWEGWKCIGNSIAMPPDCRPYIMEYGEDAQAIGVVEI
ncbi:MAG: carbon-nitrogen hydrolase family protein [Oscillospiraceae bacterium]|nr:carbon-nitrogen hydrolase family protein [Oscillospiraceae bacterium]